VNSSINMKDKQLAAEAEKTTKKSQVKTLKIKRDE
jgi:hypothetical protein